MDSTISNENKPVAEFNSSFMKKKIELESVVKSLETEGFFKRIEEDTKQIRQYLEKDTLVQMANLDFLKTSHIKIGEIIKDYDNVLSSATIKTPSGQPIQDLKSSIMNTFKGARSHTIKKIREYADSYSDEPIDKEEELLNLDREESEINYLSQLAGRLLIEKDSLDKVKQSIYSRREEFFDHEDERYDIEERFDFVNGYEIRIRKEDNKFTLDVLKDDKSVLRKKSDQSIADNRKLRKEITEDVITLNPEVDEEHLERKLLEVMTNVRGLIDDDSRKEKKIKKKSIRVNSRDAKEAMELAKHPSLMYKAKETLDMRVAGEDHLKLANYVVAMGSKFASEYQLPQGLFIRSLSGSGKTYVSKSALKLIPDENLFKIVDTTDKVLRYMKEELWGKVFFVEEWTKLSEGVAKIMRQLLTGSGDSETLAVEREGGSFETKRLKMTGTPAFISGTVMNTVDDQLVNRCWLLYNDVSPEQTQKILDFQTRSGVVKKRNEKRFGVEAEKFKNAYRVMQKVGVVNPFSGLTLNFLEGNYVTDRRQNPKIKGFINTISLMHQYQRPKVQLDGDSYIISGLGDMYMGIKVLEPFLRMSSSRIRHNAQVVYGVMCGLAGENGTTIHEIKKSHILEDKDKQKDNIDNEYVKECIAELEKHGFVESREGRYFPIDEKFEIHGLEMNKSQLEQNILEGFGEEVTQLERCGFVYENGGFRWDLYREEVVDPIDGTLHEITLDYVGDDKLKINVGRKE